MVNPNYDPSSPFPPQSTNTDAEIQRAVRGVENEAMVRRIAARMCDAARTAPRDRKHTKTTLRPLAWPVWVDGKPASCCVTVYYVLSRPRSHESERFWFSSIAEALRAFPRAQILDDVPSVLRRIEA